MNDARIFELEMMSTPTLAAHCHSLKARIDDQAHEIMLGRGSIEIKKSLMAELKTAKKILSGRQMRIF